MMSPKEYKARAMIHKARARKKQRRSAARLQTMKYHLYMARYYRSMSTDSGLAIYDFMS